MSPVTPILTREEVPEAKRWELPRVARERRAEDPHKPKQPTVAELQRIEDQARQEGYQRGLEEGRAEAQREREHKAAQLAQLFDALARPLDDVDSEVERDLAALAVRIARQVVGNAVTRQPEALVPLVRELIAMMPASTRTLSIRLHPADAALLHEALGDNDERGWRIDEDASVGRGGVRLHSEASDLDASLDARLDAAIDAALASSDDGDDNGDTA